MTHQVECGMPTRDVLVCPQEGCDHTYCIDHIYPLSYWIVIGILLQQLGNRLRWFRFLCHFLCQYPLTPPVFPVNLILLCSSLSFYFEHSVLNMPVSFFAKKRQWTHLFLVVLEHVWEPLPPFFLVFFH